MSDAVTLEMPLSPRDCAALAKCSYDTILRRIRSGHLRAFKPPGSSEYVVQPSDFQQWLYGHPVAPPHGQPGERRPQPAPNRASEDERPGSVSRLRAIERGAER